jgi:hypothetical protein
MKNHQSRPKVLHHLLKQMEHHFMVIKETVVVDVDVDVVEKKNIEVKGNVLIILTKEYQQKWIHTKTKQNENKYLRMKGHWSRTYRTPKHLVDLYQASIKEKEKWIEMNFANHINSVDSPIFLDTLNGKGISHLDVSNFFINSNRKTDLLIIS